MRVLARGKRANFTFFLKFLKIGEKKPQFLKKKRKKAKKRRNFRFFPVFFAFFCNLNLTKCVKRHLQETRPCEPWVLSIFIYRKLWEFGGKIC